MKKFTIIAAPEYEHQILGELSRIRIAQLKQVSELEFEKLKTIGERTVDFKALYRKVHESCQSLEGTTLLDLESSDLATDAMREFIDDPDGVVEAFINDLKEIQVKLEEAIKSQEEREATLLKTRAQLESLRALQPDELKKCLTVGIVDLQLTGRLEEYLQRFDDINYKVIEISSGTGFFFVFGPEKRREWVETIFLIFDVQDIFETLNTKDILLALDIQKREEVIKEYEKEVEQLQAQVESNKDINEIKAQNAPVLSKVKFFEQMLRILSADQSAPVLRTRVISVIQGWVPDNKLQDLNRIIDELQEKTGEIFFIQYDDPGKDDINIPTPDPVMKPSFLQPAYKLITLRGWPSFHEVNPGYISILVFSFQFGLMFGDVGQGAVFLLMGLFLSRKYKKGMMSKLGTLFIPMGISAVIFGILYDSIFLMEGLLFHHHQLMPNPVHETTKLMLLIFRIAAIEVIFGLVIGAINQIKSGNPIGALGEHGLGMILYIAGLYLTALHFIEIGMDFMASLSYWTFYIALAGMLLSFLEPIIHSVAHGHGIGMEVIGEGIAGLLMTFVEGLANLFSFLRIAAFALAHASLAIAAEALTHSLGITGVGLIIMNVIAMSFEFVSSTVQSMRLLYYEFMGKFFQGGGLPFKPYRIRTQRRTEA